MPRQIQLTLGDRHRLSVPRTALYAAIDAHLHAPTMAAAPPMRGMGLVLGAALGLALIPAGAAQAATITVDTVLSTLAEDGSCSLPEAVANANANAVTHVDCVAGEAGLDTIVFTADLAESTIALSQTLLVEDELAIDGYAASYLAISGGGSRILDADAPLTVTRLGLLNGGSPFIDDGGAIRSTAPLTVDGVFFAENSAKYEGGAIHARGGLTVSNSAFYANHVFGDDIYAGAGGAIFVAGSAEVTNSYFYGNSVVGSGGAIMATSQQAPVAAKGVAGAAELVVVDSEFVYNEAVLEGSGSYAAGGAVAFMPAASGAQLQHTLTVSGSVFQGNAAIPAGAPQAVSAKGGGLLPSLGGAIAVLSPSQADAKGLVEPDDVLVDIADTSFDANFALLGGGAALLASSISVEASAFSGNAAFLAGGAFMASKYGPDAVLGEGSLTLAGTTFSSNGAVLGGGVMAVASTLTATDLAVTDNVSGAPDGGPVAKGVGYPVPVFQCGNGKYGGGALLGADGVLTIAGNSVFSGNCAGSGGGALISMGPGGTGTVAPGVVFSGNVADTGAGALVQLSDASSLLFQGDLLDNTAAYAGGGIATELYAAAALTISGSTISGNVAGVDGGGGLLVGGTGGTVTVANSTLSANSAGRGGAALVQPTVIAEVTPLATVFENVTVHGNQAVPAVTAAKGVLSMDGGGIAFADGSTGVLRFVTVTGNSTAGSGGGVAVPATATVSLADSIVAGNTAAATGPDVAGTVSASFTLVQDPAGATLAGTGNVTGIDPLLGPLQDNGGATQTRLPITGSPVVDSGDPAFAPPPATDQRGAGFPRVVNGVVDMGAVEATLPQVIAIGVVPASVAEGASADISVTLDVASASDVLVTVALSGAAVGGADYTLGDADAGVPGTQVLVPAGSTSGSIALAAIADGVDEPDEAFTATVTGATGATVAGTLAASGSIVDGDAGPMVALALDQSSILEEGGSTTITATLSVPSAQDVTISLGFSGTAVQGTDYSVTGTQIVIPAGQTSGSVLLSAIDDGLDEGDETVVVDILAVSNGQESGTQQGTVVIDDTADGVAQAPAGNPQPAIIPTLSEWMLLLLGLLLPATVMTRLRRDQAPARRR